MSLQRVYSVLCSEYLWYLCCDEKKLKMGHDFQKKDSGVWDWLAADYFNVKSSLFENSSGYKMEIHLTGIFQFLYQFRKPKILTNLKFPYFQQFK